MKIEKTPIEGLYILTPSVFHDDRGCFFESYHQNKFKELGITEEFVQDNQSCSVKGVIRGLHFQKQPYAQAKLVRVVKGAVLDVAVDLRHNSLTYGKHVSVLLSEENLKQFFIPVGFAHGFVALEDETVFCYKCSAFYHKSSEGCIRFNDPTLNIDWGIKDFIVNEKDMSGEDFANFKTPF
jgi:dTDP-4-dehydrorhamnose 3,5-epimerase